MSRGFVRFPVLAGTGLAVLVFAGAALLLSLWNRCPVCGGRGMVSQEIPCSQCGGTGKVQVACPLCGGRGNSDRLVPCPTCGGNGKLPCDYRIQLADAAGRLTTVVCDHGRLVPEDCCAGQSVSLDIAQSQCPRCAGTGFVPCPTCGGRGAVQLAPPCPQCRGTGKIERTCSSCKGTGRVMAQIPCASCEKGRRLARSG